MGIVRRLTVRAAAGTIVSVAITMLISRFSDVQLDSLLSTPPSLTSLAIALSLARLGAQGTRFYLLVKWNSLVRMGLWEAFLARGVSEFFALTTIPFLADEFVRTWMLTWRGERIGPALRIAFTELALDVAVSAPLTFAASTVALARGEIVISAMLYAIPGAQLATLAALLSMAAVRGGSGLERFVTILAERVPGLGKAIEVLRSGLEPRGVSSSWQKTVILSVISVAVALTPAATLYLVFSRRTGAGFIEALYAFHAGNALGVLPVTVGGSGLTESGVYIYSSRVLGASSWEAVILWRILTYHTTLVVCGILLVFFTLHRALKLRGTGDPEGAGAGPARLE